MATLIHRLDDFTRYLGAQGEQRNVYRGQANAEWGLTPSIFRDFDPSALSGSEDYIGQGERDIFREFSDKSRRHRRDSSPWSILVLAQHYGTPTRLLDWTTNAQFALYFAVCSSPSTDGAIWCAAPSNIRMPPEVGRIHDDLGYRAERLSAYIAERDLPFCLPYSQPTGVSAPGGVGKPSFSQTDDPNLSGILTFFISEHSNDRISAQSGLFSVYLSEVLEEVVVDHEPILRMIENKSKLDILSKLVVPASAKEEILRDLDRVGIDERVIFPDLEGLSRYLCRRQRSMVKEIR